jgi:hypothetical protein
MTAGRAATRAHAGAAATTTPIEPDATATGPPSVPSIMSAATMPTGARTLAAYAALSRAASVTSDPMSRAAGSIAIDRPDRHRGAGRHPAGARRRGGRLGERGRRELVRTCRDHSCLFQWPGGANAPAPAIGQTACGRPRVRAERRSIMSPCCIAAAAATAVVTALIIVGLTGFVLVTDGFGLGLLLGTLLAAALQHWRLIGPCPRLLYAFSALLALRAAWLLATSRRPLIVAAWRVVRPGVSWAARRLTPVGRLRLRLRRAHTRHDCCGPHADRVADLSRAGPPRD